VKEALDVTYRHARRVVAGVVGGSVVAVGVAMIVLPGPAFVVIPVGLAILGVEFAWARHWLEKVKQHAQTAVDTVKGSGRSPRP
jgi:tellurite resistance protein TerC